MLHLLLTKLQKHNKVPFQFNLRKLFLPPLLPTVPEQHHTVPAIWQYCCVCLHWRCCAALLSKCPHDLRSNSTENLKYTHHIHTTINCTFRKPFVVDARCDRSWIVWNCLCFRKVLPPTSLPRLCSAPPAFVGACHSTALVSFPMVP